MNNTLSLFLLLSTAAGLHAHPLSKTLKAFDKMFSELFEEGNDALMAKSGTKGVRFSYQDSTDALLLSVAGIDSAKDIKITAGTNNLEIELPTAKIMVKADYASRYDASFIELQSSCESIQESKADDTEKNERNFYSRSQETSFQRFQVSGKLLFDAIVQNSKTYLELNENNKTLTVRIPKQLKKQLDISIIAAEQKEDPKKDIESHVITIDTKIDKEK